MTWPCENTVNQATRHLADRLHMSSCRRNRVLAVPNPSSPGVTRAPKAWPQGVPAPLPWVPRGWGGRLSAPQHSTLPAFTAPTDTRPSSGDETLLASLPHMISSCIHFKEQTFFLERGGESSHMQKIHSPGRDEERVI